VVFLVTYRADSGWVVGMGLSSGIINNSNGGDTHDRFGLPTCFDVVSKLLSTAAVAVGLDLGLGLGLSRMVNINSECFVPNSTSPPDSCRDVFY
jgi:hypothetical protein